MTTFGDLLTHRVTVVTRAAVMQGAEPVLDEDGHIQHTEQRRAGVAVAIQPLSTRERAAQHQAGVTVCTHRVYALGGERMSTADFIEHDPDACPMNPDMPLTTYELQAVQNAAGLGHHLEIDAVEIGPSITAAAASGAGSGSGAGAASGS